METKFSRIIQGCMTWGVWGKAFSTSQMIDRIHHCHENGITSYDHADIYGDYSTEKEFGEAFAHSDIARESVQLISKCGIQLVGGARSKNRVKHYQYDARYIIESAERSLQLLQTSYLDLYLLHRPSPLIHPDEIAFAIAQLKDSGKIIDFGVSNFSPSQMKLLHKKTAIDSNQIEFSLTSHDAMHDGTLDYLMETEIVPLCWSPLGSVLSEKNDRTIEINAMLSALTEKYDASSDQILLAWILKHPAKIHPVIGTTTPDRMTKAIQAVSIDLELQDWFALLEASQGHEVA